MPRSSKRYENRQHLEWVHHFRCCLHKFDKSKYCYNQEVQVHHLMKPWNGHRGMGLKANDRNLIPLCFAHHNELHQHGNEKKFFAEKTGDESYGQEVAKAYWLISPYNKDFEDDNR